MHRSLYFSLLLAPCLASAQPQIMPGPPGSERFGSVVNWLPNGNLVVVDPFFDLEDGTQNVGAVWVYRPNGSLLSRLTGATANDQLGAGEAVRGRVAIVGGSNFVVRSRNWAGGAGSVTFVDGTLGLNGTISADNSLVGSSADDRIGTTGGDAGITVLPNGDYVVESPNWDGPGAADVGAVTHGSGSTGVRGVVSAANSLVGSRAQDHVGDEIVVLSNGSYVVVSMRWDRVVDGDILVNAGAITWRNATSPEVGLVTEANSLTTDNTHSTSTSIGATITPLAQGHYVVGMTSWDIRLPALVVNAGAVTWRPGNANATGVVGPDISLIGGATEDQLGNTVMALADGNYLVGSTNFNESRGVVRWLPGSAATNGVLTSAGSLIGSAPNELLGDGGIVGLPNGAYLVLSRQWDRNGVSNVGALTYGAPGVGVSGTISSANSLVGARTADINGDAISRIAVLTNGNFVFGAEGWDNGAVVDAGAAVWGHRDFGVTGEISAANALIGSTAFDNVGSTTLVVGRSGVVALSNGHYVVNSNGWDNGAITNVGAATWGNGTTGTTGVIGPANSLIGERSGHGVGGTLPLTNGHYVVRSSNRESGFGSLGAVTWCDGSGPTSAVLSPTNSLMGTRFNDNVGSRLSALANGHYVVTSWDWNDATRTRAGAVTWGNGTGGTIGTISAANSLIGARTDDRIGITELTFFGSSTIALPDSNYVAGSQYAVVNLLRGAVTLGRGTGGTVGVVSAANSAIGGLETNGNFTVRVDYHLPTATLAVGQQAMNRVVLLRLTDTSIFGNGFE